MSVGYVTGGYRAIRGERLDYVYSATIFNDGSTVEWDATIRLVSGQLAATASGRFSLVTSEGRPEDEVRRLVESHIENLAAPRPRGDDAPGF